MDPALSRSAEFRYDDPDAGVAVMGVHSSTHVFPKHSHETYYIIGLMDEGETYCYGPEKEESLAGPGHFFIINPGQVHSGVPVSGLAVSYRMLSVNAARFCEIASNIEEGAPRPPEFPITFPGFPAGRQALNRAYAALRDGNHRLSREEALYELVALLLPQAERNRALRLPPYAEHAGLRRGEELLSCELERKLSLKEAAAAAGMSPYHFIRSFKHAYGLSPHTYRTQKRVGRAKLLLRQGVSMADAALRLGFYDQSHFSNAFHAYTGLSPSAYLAGIQ